MQDPSLSKSDPNVEAGEFCFLRLCLGKDTDQNNATGKDFSNTSTGADSSSGRAHLRH